MQKLFISFRMAACSLFLFAVLGRCFAATYYVSSTGKDTNSGTTTTAPWQTLTRVNAQAFKQGDIVLLNSQSAFSGRLQVTASGLTVDSYGGGRATINGGAGGAVYIYDAQSTTVRNLILKGGWNADTQSGNSNTGLMAFCDKPGNVQLNGLTVNNVESYGFAQYGILLASTPTDASKSGFSNVQILNCKAHDNGLGGIASYGYFNAGSTAYAHHNVTVDHCVAYKNRGVLGYTNNSGSGIVLGDVQNATVNRCTAYSNGDLNNFGGGGPVGIWTWDSDHVTVQSCESYQNHSQTGDGDGFDLDGGTTNCTLQYNYSHENDGAGYLIAEFDGARPLHGLTVRYNISQNDARKNSFGLIHVWNGGPGISDCDIYNNSVYVASHGTPAIYGVRLDTPTSGVRVRNNIFFVNAGIPLVYIAAGQTSASFLGNDYWANGAPVSIIDSGVTYPSVAAWRTATGQEKIGSTLTGASVDAHFLARNQGPSVNNADLLESLVYAYRLAASSPVLTTGLDLHARFGTVVGTRDFYGNTLPSSGAFAVGACQVRAALMNKLLVMPATGVQGGKAFLITPVLDFGAPVGGALISFTSSDLSVVPNSSAVIPFGQSYVYVSQTSKPVASDRSVVITARYNGSSISAAVPVRH
jgi:hypothetical protein